MSSKTAVTTLACAPGTLAGGPMRTRFFDGMFLTQADLENEQRYWRLKRRLTNRTLGEGVVWGLRLDWSPARRVFALSPGYALDCCGNDLVVECPVELGERELWTRADPALRTAISASAVNAAQHEKLLRACVVLQYTECAEDARPVHRDACAGLTGTCESSRVRESARLLLVPPPAKPPLTPPEKFLAELEAFRASLPADVALALFPPSPAPAPAPGTAPAPLFLQVRLPGSPERIVDVQVPGTGETATAAGLPVSTTQVPTAGRRTGVATFELTPSSGWSLTAGTVRDQGRVVETVTPPMAPSMYWALDVALPDGLAESTTQFEFVLDSLELTQTFGGTQRGTIQAKIRGALRVVASQAGNGIGVTLEELVIETQQSDVVDSVDGQSCLRELVPWGWTVDPRNGGKLARALLLAGLYSFLQEVVARAGSTVAQVVAQQVYAAAWRLLFGANLTAGAPVTDEHRRALVELIVKLFRRWCDGFFYPGPRCADEHHGVYLGCVEMDRSGQILRFDPWEHRRYVLTGPLLTHWAAQFGIAPLDTIVGRLVSALCCIAGLTPIVPGPGEDVISGRLSAFHVGTSASVATYALGRGATARWVSAAELAGKTATAFTARADGRPVDVLATQVAGGGAIAIAVPARANRLDSRIRADVRTLLRRGEQQTRERGRAAVGDFVEALLRLATAAAVVDDTTSADARKVAEEASQRATTAADLVEDGADALVVRVAMGNNPGVQEGSAELVELAERSVDNVAVATVELFGPKVDRATFGIPAKQAELAKMIERRKLLKVSADIVKAAAMEASRG